MSEEGMCTCAEPNPSGSLNDGAEVCMNCGWLLKKPMSTNQPDADIVILLGEDAGGDGR